ncbi:MAG TPA: carboxypeptidase-like regulatory domain-containing protein [Polyangia bacterium]|nr:carboxypeptidase-like regulatory domain-containing protein [Polyangia bacterium]
MPRRVATPTLTLSRSAAAGVALACALGAVAACGGTEAVPAAPRLIPGGGVGDGAIAGRLNVYVTDEDTRAPVAGASVRVGASAAAAPCTILTDSTGLAVFDKQSCPALEGKQTLTATATGYVPATVIGVNATNVTTTLSAVNRPPIDTATVTGTIAGWDALPAPATGHQTLAIIASSQTRELGDRANEIPQGTRSVTVPVIGAFNIPANVCVRNASANDCAWRLTTRTGAQAHYAVVLDQDTKGTPANDADDTTTVIAWAVKTGLSFSAGQTASGESLALLADTQMRSFRVAMSTPPSGLDSVAGFPMLDLGGDGRVPITAPVLDLTTTTTRVPALSGDLAGARYDLLAMAQDAKDKDQPSTLAWLHQVNAGATVSIGGWLTPPTGLSVSAGVFTFSRVANAALHSIDLETTTGGKLWSISIFDDTSSLTLPGLSPDPLPAGMARFKVNALEIPGVDLQNVAFDDAREKIVGLSSDQIPFSH